MKQSTELTKIIADVQKIVAHEDDVLGYKVIVKNSEVKAALKDLGYVLDYKQGSKKEKMFYQLPLDPTQARTPADETNLLNDVSGYIISLREEENYFANPVKKTDEKKAAGELEKKVDDAVKPKDEKTEVIPAPKERSNWAYWGIGLFTAAVALRFLYSWVPATPERSHREDVSQCTQSLNAAAYDPRGQSASAIVDKVKSHIDGTQEDLYLGPGCENAANELYARLHGVKGAEATFLRALETSWDVCNELTQSPTKVIHYKKQE